MFGESWEQNGSKLGQVGSKMTAICEQVLNKLVASWEQVGRKIGARLGARWVYVWGEGGGASWGQVGIKLGDIFGARWEEVGRKIGTS